MASQANACKAARSSCQPGKQYPVQEALTLLKKFATVKFTESVDVAVNLGIDAKKSDQVVRGSTVLPHGTGKSLRVAVFAQGNNAEAAKPGRCRRGGLRGPGREDQGRADGLRPRDRDAPTPCAWSASWARSWVPAA